MHISPAYVLDGPTVLLFAVNSLYLTDRLYFVLQKTQEMAFHFRDPKFEKRLGEHAPSRPPCLGRFGRANFSSPACTFKISRYTANYRHLIAYEINAQGWKKRLSLEGVGGGGGGVQFSYVIILVGYSFDTPHFYTFLNPPPPPPGRNKPTVPNKSHNSLHGRVPYLLD